MERSPTGGAPPDAAASRFTADGFPKCCMALPFGLVALAAGKHPFPSRTRPLRLHAVMILRPGARESNASPILILQAPGFRRSQGPFLVSGGGWRNAPAPRGGACPDGASPSGGDPGETRPRREAAPRRRARILAKRARAAQRRLAVGRGSWRNAPAPRSGACPDGASPSGGKPREPREDPPR